MPHGFRQRVQSEAGFGRSLNTWFWFSVSSYTREAGVRALERRLSAVCRAAAVKIVEANPDDLRAGHIGIDQEVLEEILGPPLFEFDIDSR